MFLEEDAECGVVMAKLVPSGATQSESMSHLCCSVTMEPCTLPVRVGRAVMVCVEVNLKCHFSGSTSFVFLGKISR